MADSEVRVTFELPRGLALALAQFCKRSTFEDFARRSMDRAEAYEMVDAIGIVGRALADAGFDPR